MDNKILRPTHCTVDVASCRQALPAPRRSLLVSSPCASCRGDPQGLRAQDHLAHQDPRTPSRHRHHRGHHRVLHHSAPCPPSLARSRLCPAPALLALPTLHRAHTDPNRRAASRPCRSRPAPAPQGQHAAEDRHTSLGAGHRAGGAERTSPLVQPPTAVRRRHWGRGGHSHRCCLATRASLACLYDRAPARGRARGMRAGRRCGGEHMCAGTAAHTAAHTPDRGPGPSRFNRWMMVVKDADLLRTLRRSCARRWRTI